MQLPHLEVGREDIRYSYPGFTNSRQVLGNIEEIKASILSNGLITPPVVWAVEDEDGDTQYVLVAGHRRMAAIEQLVKDDSDKGEEFAVINCAVLVGTLEDAIRYNVIENLERENLNPADEIDAIANIIEHVGTQTKAAEVLNRSQPWISGRWNLYTGLSGEAKEALRYEHINLKQAKQLSKLITKDGAPDTDAQATELSRMKGEDVATPEQKGKNKKERTIKNKSDVANLLARYVDADEDIDPQHRQSVITVIGWYFGQVDDVDAPKPLPENVIAEITALTTDGKDRVKEETAKAKLAEKLAKEEKAKAEKEKKDAEKKATAEKKAADKLAKDAAAAEAKAAKEAEAAKKAEASKAALAAAKGKPATAARPKVEAAVPAPADDKPKKGGKIKIGV